MTTEKRPEISEAEKIENAKKLRDASDEQVKAHVAKMQAREAREAKEKAEKK